MAFLKNNWLIVSVSVIFLVAMLILHSNVYLYGDDFVYGTYGRFGLNHFLDSHIDHYLHTNGRAIVHVIVSLVTLCDVWLFRVLGPFMLLAVLLLITFITNREKKGYGQTMFAVTALFCAINVSMSRESVYWLDGAFNYVYPVLLMSVNTFLLLRSMETGRVKNWYPILGFFFAATTEQGAMMCLGQTVLILMYHRYLLKKEPERLHYAWLIAVFLGCLSVILAPGTFSRAGSDAAWFNEDGVKILLNWFLYSESTVLFHLAVAVLAANKAIAYIAYVREKGVMVKAVCYFSIVGILAYVFLAVTNMTSISFDISGESNVLITVGFCYITGVLAVSVMAAFFEQQPVPAVFFICAIGSQIMMVIDPVYRERTMFAGVMCLIFTAAGFQSLLGRRITQVFIIFFILGAVNQFGIINGYATNAAIHEKNIEIIQSARVSEDVTHIELLRLTDDTYGYNPLQSSDYHIEYLKQFYNIESVDVTVKIDGLENAVYLDGEKLILGFNPILENRLLYLPVAKVSESLGYFSDWDNALKTAIFTNGTNVIKMTLNEHYIELNGDKIPLNYPVSQHDYRTVLDHETFCKVFGLKFKLEENGGVELYLTQ